MQRALQLLQSLLYQGSMVALLLGTGIWFTLKTRFFQLRGLPFILKNTLGTFMEKDVKSDLSSISPFQAMSTALAGTLGVGNIAGVATALTLGGPGAIFWMWISAFFGMMTKYSEIFLAVKFREKTRDGFRGGPMYYMKNALNKPWLGGIFALLCALTSFGIGNMTQVNAVSGAALAAFGIPPWASGILVATLLALIVFGGLQRIASVNEVMIPFISIAYIACSVTVLIHNKWYLGSAFALIFRGAFVPAGMVGGVLGHGLSSAVRYGISRGVFTNEAGLGSAPIAHACADCKSPAHQSVWGIFEVFLDTIVVCTLTALVLLTAQKGTLWQSGLDGVEMTSAAFASVFGPKGAGFIAISVMCFAVAGMLGWCFYGETAIGFLTGESKAAIHLYRWLFIACAVVGAVGEMRRLWGLADALNAMMAIPNVAAMILLRRHIQLPQGASPSH